jgi:uncharacterized RDD family membrane protein YckC
MNDRCPACGADYRGTPYCTACGARVEETPAIAPPAPASYASFGRRLAAFLLDGMLVGATGLLLALGASAAYFAGARQLPEGYWQDGFLTWWMVIGGVLLLAYHTVFVGGSGQTPGKRTLGIAVADVGVRRLGYGRAFLRTLCYEVSAFLCYLGFLWALWDKRHQAWHDKIAGTVVVRRD